MSKLDFRVEQVGIGCWRLWVTCEKDNEFYRAFDSFGDPFFQSDADAYQAGLEWAACIALEETLASSRVPQSPLPASPDQAGSPGLHQAPTRLSASSC